MICKLKTWHLRFPRHPRYLLRFSRYDAVNSGMWISMFRRNELSACSLSDISVATSATLDGVMAKKFTVRTEDVEQDAGDNVWT